MCQPATHYITLPLPSHSLLLQKRDTVVYVGVVYDPYFLISDLHPIVICVHFRKENDELFPKAGYNVCETFRITGHRTCHAVLFATL